MYAQMCQYPMSNTSLRGRCCYFILRGIAWLLACAPCASEGPCWAHPTSDANPDPNLNLSLSPELVLVHLLLYAVGRSLRLWKAATPEEQVTIDAAEVRRKMERQTMPAVKENSLAGQQQVRGITSRRVTLQALAACRDWCRCAQTDYSCPMLLLTNAHDTADDTQGTAPLTSVALSGGGRADLPRCA
jgi:hypothetical protein